MANESLAILRLSLRRMTFLRSLSLSAAVVPVLVLFGGAAAPAGTSRTVVVRPHSLTVGPFQTQASNSFSPNCGLRFSIDLPRSHRQVARSGDHGIHGFAPRDFVSRRRGRRLGATRRLAHLCRSSGGCSGRTHAPPLPVCASRRRYWRDTEVVEPQRETRLGAGRWILVDIRRRRRAARWHSLWTAARTYSQWRSG